MTESTTHLLSTLCATYLEWLQSQIHITSEELNMQCKILGHRPAPHNDSVWKNVCYVDVEWTMATAPEGRIIARNILVKRKKDDQGEHFFFAPKAVQIDGQWVGSLSFENMPAMQLLREAFVRSCIPGKHGVSETAPEPENAYEMQPVVPF